MLGEARRGGMWGMVSYLLVVMLVVEAWSLGSCQPTFCGRTLSRITCPGELPTFDQVDLQKYSGRWYEIGSNAYFKNLQEAGGICVSAVYTPTNESYIKVFNSQTRVVGDLGASLVRGISSQAAQICQGARQICQEIQTGTISMGLRVVQEVAMNLSQTYPEESSLLLESKTGIDKALLEIDIGLDSLSKSVSQIQVLNSQLSQADGKAADRVDELSGVAARINAEVVDAIILLKLADIAAARKNITSVAGKLYLNKDTKQISQQLFRAVSQILDLEERVPGQAATIRATVEGTAESAASCAFEKNEGVGGFVSINGKAFQNFTAGAGKLLVTFDALPTPPAKYWILKVLDEKSEDYGAAIVYGCSEIAGAGIYQPLFILSRQPTISDNVSKAFFEYVQSLGIYQDCHEVFIGTSQPETCQYPSPQV